jgi:hypothetical protein
MALECLVSFPVGEYLQELLHLPLRLFLRPQHLLLPQLLYLQVSNLQLQAAQGVFLA